MKDHGNWRDAWVQVTTNPVQCKNEEMENVNEECKMCIAVHLSNEAFMQLKRNLNLFAAFHDQLWNKTRPCL